jgi:hypothetical protein
MIKNFTTKDLLLFIYNEMTPSKISSLKIELKKNPSLQKELDELKSELELLDTPKYHSPHNTTLSIIFESVEQNEDHGILEY